MALCSDEVLLQSTKFTTKCIADTYNGSILIMLGHQNILVNQIIPVFQIMTEYFVFTVDYCCKVKCYQQEKAEESNLERFHFPHGFAEKKSIFFQKTVLISDHFL